MHLVELSYKYKQINLISKFTIGDYIGGYKNGLSRVFWNTIFDCKYFSDFIVQKYLPYKTKNKGLSRAILGDIKFVLSKLKNIKSKINLISNKRINGEDLFFSYILFSKILNIYNDFYKKNNVKASLLRGLIFNYNQNLNTVGIINEFEEKYLNNNDFLDEFVKKLGKKNNLFNDNCIYKLKIFWPDELIVALYFGKIVKEEYKNSKIILDLSEANEQFDFTQWKSLIEEKVDFFSNYIDYFIFHKDFGNSERELLSILNGKNENITLTNIIDISSGKFIEYPEKKDESIIIFFADNINETKIVKLYNKKSVFVRMFPYKCYWARCNFCTINSGNPFVYNEKFSYIFFVDKWVEFIRENNIYSIVFSDEAIPPKQIINFANKIIENNLNIIYQFRTRFDKIYTKKICNLLYKSGARYCGIGLEAVSSRVNEDIANKGERNISLKEKLEIIHNFDNSGVSVHNYSIMGFPTETKLETISTYNFLIQNIKNSNHFTATPNVFGLMKGSYLYNNTEEYGIKINNYNDDNLFNLNFNFSYKNGEKRNTDFFHNLAEKIHMEQFLPWLKGNKDFYKYGFTGRGFWDYIDRSSYFYEMKMIYEKNPYREFVDINKEILTKDINEVLKAKYSLSNGLQIIKIDKKFIYLYDWINFISFYLELIYKSFLNNFNHNIYLIENLKSNQVEVNEQDLRYLLENRILIIRNGSY